MMESINGLLYLLMDARRVSGLLAWMITHLRETWKLVLGTENDMLRIWIRATRIVQAIWVITYYGEIQHLWQQMLQPTRKDLKSKLSSKFLFFWIFKMGTNKMLSRIVMRKMVKGQILWQKVPAKITAVKCWCMSIKWDLLVKDEQLKWSFKEKITNLLIIKNW